MISIPYLKFLEFVLLNSNKIIILNKSLICTRINIFNPNVLNNYYSYGNKDFKQIFIDKVILKNLLSLTLNTSLIILMFRNGNNLVSKTQKFYLPFKSHY